MEEGPVETVLQREVEIEPNVRLECEPKFYYVGDKLGAGGGVDEAARARGNVLGLSSRSYRPFDSPWCIT